MSGKRCEQIANRMNAELTALEGREAALSAAWSRGDRKKALQRDAEVAKRQARMMRAKDKK